MGGKASNGAAIEPILRMTAGLRVPAARASDGFVRRRSARYCANTQASAEAIVSYHAPDKAMDTPHIIPRIQAPTLVIAGSEDTVYAGLIEKHERLADGERVQLLVIDGADHFFRDLYAEDMADAVAEQLGVD